MDADSARLEAGLADLVDLRRDVEVIKRMMLGKIEQTISVPSGVDGFNFSYKVIAEQIGAEPAPEASLALPFSASYNPEEGTITVGAGKYQVGVDGEWVGVAESGPTAGSKAYLCIKSDGTDVVEVKIEIVSTAKDATNFDAGSEFIEWSNVLLAEVIDDAIVQRRNGNFLITTWVINGYPAFWPETIIGEP